MDFSQPLNQAVSPQTDQCCFARNLPHRKQSYWDAVTAGTDVQNLNGCKTLLEMTCG